MQYIDIYAMRCWLQ